MTATIAEPPGAATAQASGSARARTCWARQPVPGPGPTRSCRHWPTAAAVGSMLGELIAHNGAAALQYCAGQGDERLRERICDVMALEGITGASADDVVVTVGSQQALDLISRVFLDPGDVVLAEGPSYVGALGTFAAAEAEVVHVPLDGDGLIPAALTAVPARLEKLCYLMPLKNWLRLSVCEGRLPWKVIFSAAEPMAERSPSP